MRPRKTPWYRRVWQSIKQELRWFAPGLGVKRWVGVILVGTALIGLGFAVFLLDFYRTAPDAWWLPVLSILSLRFMARPLRALFFGGSGVIMILVGIWGLNRSLLRPFVRPGTALLDTVTAFRKKERGPRLVALGGGHGLACLLRGVKSQTHNLTAIVTVADDGGSSGDLRRSRGILPPGDIRNCLTALSNDEQMLSQIFQYRFSSGDGLEGHSLGNLFIAALADITGSFEEGVAESGRVLAVQGRVLPSTLHDVRLVADVHLPDKKGDVRVKGESQIPLSKGQIKRIWLEPNNPLAYPPTLQAILNADLIVIGPGSLYTSLLPNLLVPDIAEAIRSSRALKFYVCNVATQPGETDGFSCDDHVSNIEKHLGGHFFDLIICNNRYNGKLLEGVSWVRPEANLEEKYAVYFADLIDSEYPWRHDSNKLAQVIMDLYNERTGPLMSKEENDGRNSQ